MSEVHDQLDAEGVLREEQATNLAGKLKSTGRLCLTRERLVFLAANRGLMAFGALGAAASIAKRPANIALEIPLSAIQGIERTRYGLQKNVLAVTDGAGETHRIAVKSYDDWAQALRDAGVDAAVA